MSCLAPLVSGSPSKDTSLKSFRFEILIWSRISRCDTGPRNALLISSRVDHTSSYDASLRQSSRMAFTNFLYSLQYSDTYYLNIRIFGYWKSFGTFEFSTTITKRYSKKRTKSQKMHIYISNNSILTRCHQKIFRIFEYFTHPNNAHCLQRTFKTFFLGLKQTIKISSSFSAKIWYTEQAFKCHW